MEAIDLILIGCFGILVVLILVEAVRSRRVLRGLGQLAILALAGLLLWLWIGFPRLEGGDRRHFGAGGNPWPMIILIFVCIVVGMAARYFFYLKGKASWGSLLKPLCVSPIVLLPLLGTLQDTAQLEPIQVVSFCLLAFQNGFFWKVVFERAQQKLES
ncbi:MAG TPA: hypothetical protein VF017_13075 [Thermoanaerobaculia bacterium]|nr:hypothetical protein [Thermoanaerobaculia bacterium]